MWPFLKGKDYATILSEASVYYGYLAYRAKILRNGACRGITKFLAIATILYLNQFY